MSYPGNEAIMTSYYHLRQVKRTLTLPNYYALALALDMFTASITECRTNPI